MPQSPRLRVLVIGAGGVLGQAVVAELSPRCDIVSAGSKSGEIRIDIADPASIEAGLKAAGPLDAVACAAGAVNFHPFSAIKPAPRRTAYPGRACWQRSNVRRNSHLSNCQCAVLRIGGALSPRWRLLDHWPELTRQRAR